MVTMGSKRAAGYSAVQQKIVTMNKGEVVGAPLAARGPDPAAEARRAEIPGSNPDYCGDLRLRGTRGRRLSLGSLPARSVVDCRSSLKQINPFTGLSVRRQAINDLPALPFRACPSIYRS